jgi:hypothetical protein
MFRPGHLAPGIIETLGADTSNSRGTAVPAGNAAFGSWTSLGTCNRGASAIYLTVHWVVDDHGRWGRLRLRGGTGRIFLDSVFLWGEQTLTGQQVPLAWWLPLYLKPGEEVFASALAHSSFGGNMYTMIHTIAPLPGFGYQRAEAVGIAGTTGADQAKLTLLADPGGTAHTKGAWTEVSSSLPFHAKAFMVMTQADAGIASRRGLLDVGIGDDGSGGAGSVLVSNLEYVHEDRNMGGLEARLFPRDIPSGTRIVMRHQSASTTTNIRRCRAGLLIFR